MQPVQGSAHSTDPDTTCFNTMVQFPLVKNYLEVFQLTARYLLGIGMNAKNYILLT